MSRGARQEGFTLLEVVVAFAVFALSIGAIYGLFAGAIKRSLKGSERLTEVLVAQSLLAELKVRPGPWPTSQKGQTDEGMAWELVVSPYEMQLDAESAFQPVQVTVIVQTRRKLGSALRLRSIELMYRPRAEFQ